MRISRSIAALLCCAGALLCAARAGADAASEVPKFSVFPQIDLQKLAGGKVMAARGPAMSFPRDLSVQALYVVPAPLSKTFELHRQWEPTRHPELKVYLHGEIGSKLAAGDFSRINSAPGNSAVRALAAATQKLPAGGDLQLSGDEAKQFAPGSGSGAMPPAVASFWAQLLTLRAQSFLKRGMAGQPAYDFDGQSIMVAEEAARLMKEQPKIRSQFDSFIRQTALGGGGLAPSLYWELFDVDGEAAFVLGASYGQLSDDTARMLDLQYYASGGFLAFVTLYQMWPVMIDGRAATLVWRGDSLASRSLSELHGVEKMGSGAAMMKEVQKNAAFFLKDASR